MTSIMSLKIPYSKQYYFIDSIFRRLTRACTRTLRCESSPIDEPKSLDSIWWWWWCCCCCTLRREFSGLTVYPLLLTIAKTEEEECVGSLPRLLLGELEAVVAVVVFPRFWWRMGEPIENKNVIIYVIRALDSVSLSRAEVTRIFCTT